MGGLPYGQPPNDASESQTDYGETFEDEPGHQRDPYNNNQYDGNNYNDQQSYAASSPDDYSDPNHDEQTFHNDTDSRYDDQSTFYNNNDGNTMGGQQPSYDDYNNTNFDSNSNDNHQNQDQCTIDDQDPYEQPRSESGRYDQDDDYHRNMALFQDHDPYAQRQYQTPNDHDEDGIMRDTNDPNRHDDSDLEESPPPEQPRKHKYSTANVNETGKWKKWCCICCIFLLFMAFMIGLSMLFDHFFFGDTSDNGPMDMQRPENGTFSKDKRVVDAACGRTTFLDDGGALCQETCVPQYFECCDPFDEFTLYNFTKNETITEYNQNDTSSHKYDLSDPKNTSFMDAYDEFDNLTCSFDQETRGCMAYAKCQALSGQADPAPNNLPEMCSLETLTTKGEKNCKEVCRKLDCCYSSGSDNCLAEKFDLCMDYAPCQNLRILENPHGLVETAPLDLDNDCYWQLPSCFESCEKAKCCADPTEDSCFEYNFLSCLTYSPCTNVTDVNIVLPPQFSHVPKPPERIIYACDANHEKELLPASESCEEMCAGAACCFADATVVNNCFSLDPLGCMAWSAQCQVLKVD